MSESAAARDLTLSEAGVTAWMEAARRRRLIVRWNEPSGADDRRLPEAEWELTPVGASAHQRSQWRPRFLSAGRGMWAVIAALGVLLALIQALAGKRVVPDAGLLSSVHLSGSPAVDLQPMVVAAISVLAMQASAAGRKRHWITHACRLLESQGAKSLPAPTD
ncbi:MAG TPA: hypothetical protein VKB03_09015 [Conexibacter sp.]|nr:hypothetical protein [Conexibacter sp.]